MGLKTKHVHPRQIDRLKPKLYLSYYNISKLEVKVEIYFKTVLYTATVTNQTLRRSFKIEYGKCILNVKCWFPSWVGLESCKRQISGDWSKVSVKTPLWM